MKIKFYLNPLFILITTFLLSFITSCQDANVKRDTKTVNNEEGNPSDEFTKIDLIITVENEESATDNLNSANLTYRLNYAALNKEGNIKFADFKSHLVIKKFPVNEIDKLVFEVYENDALKLKDVIEELTVYPDDEEIEISLKDPSLFESNQGNHPNPPAPPPGRPIKDIRFVLPDQWKINQDALNEGTIILGIIPGNMPNSDAYVTFYARDIIGLDMKTIFVNGSTIDQDLKEETIGSYAWKTIVTVKDSIFVAGFLMEFKGKTYFGYVSSSSKQSSVDVMKQFLNGLHQRSNYEYKFI